MEGFLIITIIVLVLLNLRSLFAPRVVYQIVPPTETTTGGSCLPWLLVLLLLGALLIILVGNLLGSLSSAG